MSAWLCAPTGQAVGGVLQHFDVAQVLLGGADGFVAGPLLHGADIQPGAAEFGRQQQAGDVGVAQGIEGELGRQLRARGAARGAGRADGLYLAGRELAFLKVRVAPGRQDKLVEEIIRLLALPLLLSGGDVVEAGDIPAQPVEGMTEMGQVRLVVAGGATRVLGSVPGIVKPFLRLFTLCQPGIFRTSARQPLDGNEKWTGGLEF